MHILNKKKQQVHLVRLETEVIREAATRGLAVAVCAEKGTAPCDTGALVGRAARAFFEIGRRPAGKASPPKQHEGPPPAAYREERSGLLRIVYRELVVRFDPKATQARRNAILKQYHLEVRRKNLFVSNQVVVYNPERRYSGDELLEIGNWLAEMDEVVFAAPNFVSQYRRQLPRAAAVAVRERAAALRIRREQWHLRNRGSDGAKAGEDVSALAAWKTTRGKRGIVVAVLDDGVDVDHPNLRSRIWKNPDPAARDRIGRDFFLPADHPDHFNPRPKVFHFPYDQMRGNDIHGTCCAGVAAAAGSAGGALGVAPGCRILAVKIFHADDLAPDEAVANAIRYAARHADVLSCSWTGGESPDVEQALEDAGSIGRKGKGAAVFCAAGNEERSPVGFPASDPNAIAVGASTDQGELAWYSNVGPEIAFVAPSSGGVHAIFTTDVSYPKRGFNLGLKEKGGADGLHTNDFGGTSSATPLAAGVAALVLSVNPKLDRKELKDVLASTADKIGKEPYDRHGHSKLFGSGRLNAGRAVRRALGKE